MNNTERVTYALFKWIVLATGMIGMFWLGYYFETGTGEMPKTHAIKEWNRWFDLVLGIILPAIIIPTMMSKRANQPGATKSILTGLGFGALVGIVAMSIVLATPFFGSPNQTIAAQPSEPVATNIQPANAPQSAAGNIQTIALPVATSSDLHPFLPLVGAWFIAVLLSTAASFIKRPRPWQQSTSGLAIGAWFGLSCIASPVFGLPLGIEMAVAAIVGAALYCHWGFMLSEFRPTQTTTDTSAEGKHPDPPAGATPPAAT